MRLKESLHSFKHILLKFCLIILFISGSLALLLAVGAFTSIPYYTRVWLGTHNSTVVYDIKNIIMLGGGGMPEEGNLMRLYYTARLANDYQDARVIIAHPWDSMVMVRMRTELIQKGIDSARIVFVHKGANTRSQALAIRDSLPEIARRPVAVVTAPEQMLRAVLTFRKLGYRQITGCPTMQHDMNKGLLYKSREIGGREMVPDVGQSLAFRYNFWNYMIMEIQCIREFAALGYYWVNGWI